MSGRGKGTKGLAAAKDAVKFADFGVFSDGEAVEGWDASGDEFGVFRNGEAVEGWDASDDEDMPVIELLPAKKRRRTLDEVERARKIGRMIAKFDRLYEANVDKKLAKVVSLIDEIVGDLTELKDSIKM